MRSRSSLYEKGRITMWDSGIGPASTARHSTRSATLSGDTVELLSILLEIRYIFRNPIREQTEASLVMKLAFLDEK